MKYLIFDFDGVLVDSMSLYMQTILGILDERSISYNRDNVITNLMTRKQIEKMQYLIDTFGVDAKAEDLESYVIEQCNEAYLTKIPAKESVKETLSAMQRSGYSLNVLTATAHPTVDLCLKRLGLDSFFEHVWTCEDFGLSKTDAALFEAVAEKPH